MTPHERIFTTRGLYLNRWFLKKKKPKHANAYLHNAVDSDDSRALHDHPWHNLSIILRGGYIEHVFAYAPVDGHPPPPVIQKYRRAGQIIFRPADLAHRLELYPRWHSPAMNSTQLVPCWSLFVTWRKSREWGFWCQRRGLIGAIDVPVRGEERTVVLRTLGLVASWIHQTGFLAKDGCP